MQANLRLPSIHFFLTNGEASTWIGVFRLAVEIKRYYMRSQLINIATLIFVISMLSCDDSEIEKSGTASRKLIRESHYVYDTNELLKELNYSYNAKAQLLQETSLETKSGFVTERKYEYDSQGLLEKVITDFPDGYSISTTYVYENGLKKVEDHEEGFGIYRQVFYYTNTTLDSIERYSIILQMEPDLMNTQLFTYENGLLAKESFKATIDMIDGPKTMVWDGVSYTYHNQLLQSKCYGENECTNYFYNNANKLITVTENYYGEERILEELRYEFGLLTEKILHHYTDYCPEGFIDKTIVRYSYE
jgi:hypothetical protein